MCENGKARLSAWTIRHLPPVLITETAWVMLGTAMFGLGLATGLAALAGDSGIMGQTLVLQLLRALWSLSLFVGGIAHIVGIARSWRIVERLGMSLCIIGCLAYSLALFGTGRPASIAIAVVFIIFAAGYSVRIMVSTLFRVVRA